MQNRLNNTLGFRGWISGGRYGLDRYAYTLHRITGLGILVYFIMHIFVTGARLGGPQSWDAQMAFFSSPVFKLGELLVFLAFAFHAVNGIRLVIVELGYMLGEPGLHAYPYRHSALRQKPLVVVVMVIAAVIMVIGGADFYMVMK